MFEYKTVEEKALEWGVTLRHVQHLCRAGKIDGAVKRAGAWFIPCDALSPIKNTKADDKSLRFVGTKKKIFENSIKLFTQRGYENVSISDIADSVGIWQSAVYNHFKSKQEILETIYEFYYHNYVTNRPSMDIFETELQAGSTMDIVTKGFIYEFDESVIGKMFDITKIIMQRMTTDAKAAELFQKLLLEEGISFVEGGFNRAVEIGKLAPFDIHTISVLINCVRLYTLLWWMAAPSDEVRMKVAKDEQAMYEHIVSLLTDLKPTVDQ